MMTRVYFKHCRQGILQTWQSVAPTKTEAIEQGLTFNDRGEFYCVDHCDDRLAGIHNVERFEHDFHKGFVRLK